MTAKFFIFLFSLLALSCASSTKQKTFTLILTYKEHQKLKDNVQPKELKEIFSEGNAEKAYSYGTLKFASFASSWNDTVFWAPIEPLSFKIVDNNNVDIRTLIDKSTIQKMDSSMWADINRKRELMSKTKNDFLNRTTPSRGGLTNSVDSLAKKKTLQAAKKE